MQPPRNNRLMKELSDLSKKGVPGVKVQQRDDNILLWDVIIDGPVGTVYEGGHFKLELNFPQQYPMKPPEAKFCTKIYHLNISDGHVCGTVLDKWAPSVMMERFFKDLLAIMANPNADHPRDARMGVQYMENRAEYEATARRWTQEYAK